MNIAGFSKLTLLDYPNLLACEIFTQGCNMACPFCQNSELISITNNSNYSEELIFEYLRLRKKILDGVVITGGEPTMQPDLINFIKKSHLHSFFHCFLEPFKEAERRRKRRGTEAEQRHPRQCLKNYHITCRYTVLYKEH